jgi:aspartyl-tRNA(Asn)/glutamyl-tRNA(Gln) amidotransferase subunit C
MSVDAETVVRVARLARLKLTSEEVPLLQGEINGILGWIEQLQQVDVAGVEPMTSVASMNLRWREDAVTDGNNVDAVLKNAPEANMGFYAVPKVIE